MYLSNPSDLCSRGRVTSTPSAICVTPCNRQFTRLHGILSRRRRRFPIAIFPLTNRPKISREINRWKFEGKKNRDDIVDKSYLFIRENCFLVSSKLYISLDPFSEKGYRWEKANN